MGARARVAAINQGGRFARDAAGNRELMMGLLDEALEVKPDVVCLPEAFAAGNLGNLPLKQRVEPVPGPSTDAAARRAREARCYVISAVKTEREGRFWNSAVLLDRSGGIAGIYDKACPVTRTPDYTEMEGGITPGSEIPVFDLDFGRVGVQICFDLGFEENWAALAGKGARMVFWSSACDGGFPLRCFAYLHHYYVVSSVRRGRSRVIDPLGAVLEESADGPGFVHRDVNLDHVVYHGDFNFEVAERIGAAYGERVEVRDSAPGSGHRLVEPADESVSTPRLMEEFGFESSRQYHDRHREAYRHLRAGRPAPPQEAAHRRRAQYPGD